MTGHRTLGKHPLDEKDENPAKRIKLKVTDIAMLDVEQKIESKESCTRMIFDALQNGSSYVVKIDPKSHNEIQFEDDAEVAALFFIRLLSPYHEKHPEAYHAFAQYKKITDEQLIKNILAESSSDATAATHAPFLRASGVAVKKIKNFKTLKDFSPEQINLFLVKRKLRGYGVATAVAKILNMSDLQFKNMAIVDAHNLENDDEKSFATIVPHDGDSSFSMKSERKHAHQFQKTSRDFQLKISAKDYAPFHWPNKERRKGKYYKVPEKKSIKCTDEIAYEHDITIYHLLLMPSTLLDKLMRRICKYKNPEAINNMCNQLRASQETYLDIARNNADFKKLIDKFFKEGAVEKFIQYLTTLAPEFNTSRIEIQSFAQEIRNQEVMLRQPDPLFSMLADDSDEPMLISDASHSTSSGSSSDARQLASAEPKLTFALPPVKSAPAADSIVAAGTQVSPSSFFSEKSPTAKALDFLTETLAPITNPLITQQQGDGQVNLFSLSNL